MRTNNDTFGIILFILLVQMVFVFVLISLKLDHRDYEEHRAEQMKFNERIISILGHQDDFNHGQVDMNEDILNTLQEMQQ